MSYSFDSFVLDATRFVQALLSTESTSSLLSCDLISVSDKDPSFDVLILYNVDSSSQENLRPTSPSVPLEVLTSVVALWTSPSGSFILPRITGFRSSTSRSCIPARLQAPSKS